MSESAPRWRVWQVSDTGNPVAESADMRLAAEAARAATLVGQRVTLEGPTGAEYSYENGRWRSLYGDPVPPEIEAT